MRRASLTSALVTALAAVAGAQTVAPVQTFEAPDATINARFGYALSATGTHLLVGATNDDEAAAEAGAAYVYAYSGGDWTFEDKLVASEAGPQDLFGSTVALEGDRAVVGAYLADGVTLASGAVYVFERLPSLVGTGTWGEVARLVPSDGDVLDHFGCAVALSGDRILVGATHNEAPAASPNSDPGAAYIFERRPDGTWDEVAKLVPSALDDGHFFGWSVDLDGDRAIVGASQDDTAGPAAGAAYVFERQPDGTWPHQRLSPPDLAAGDSFGIGVAIDGDDALVSATGDDVVGSGSGLVYAYRRQPGGGWAEVDRLIPPELEAGDAFGTGLSLSGRTAVIGAFADDDDGDTAGSAYLYTRLTDGSWRRATKLHAEAGATLDRFGYASAVHGTRAFVGAFGGDGSLPDTGTVGVFDAWVDLGGASVGAPRLTAMGVLLEGEPFRVDLADAAPSAPMLAWLSFGSTPFAALGGTVHAFPFALQLPRASDVNGALSEGGAWPEGIPAGTDFWLQFIAQDPSVPGGLALSNAVTATTP